MFTRRVQKEARELEQEWRKEYSRLYDGRECDLRTDSGIPLKPVYTPADVQKSDFRDIGMPGVSPYTRGTYPLLYQFSMWTTQQGMGYGLPEQTRERYDLLRQQGLDAHEGMVPQYFVVPDAVVQEGYDPDHPAARGQVGVVGSSWCNVKDMEVLFGGLPLDKTGVVFATYDSSLPTLAMYVACAENMGFYPEQLRGHTVANFYRQTCWDLRSFAPENELKVATEYIRYCSHNIPRWSPISFQGYGFQEAGATPVQELAFMLATAVAFTDACVEAGLTADDFVGRYGFHVAIDDDFFEAIAKVRALRRMWARIAAERWGCKRPKSLATIIQTETAGTSLTAQQPLNNIVRAGIGTLAAVLAGATSIWTTHYDEALSIPTEESATLCLRTQQVIYHESNVAKVVDPLGGSYYVEWLTNRVEEEASKLMKRIEDIGYLNCWRSGWFRRELERSSYEWRQALEKGERVKVGVNRYYTEEDMKPRLFRSDPKAEDVLVQRVREFRARRDSAKVQAALGELKKVAMEVKERWPKHNAELMPAVLDSVKANATLGEVMGVLKEVYGWAYTY
ncbi:MAG: methylmalonyl-CoA mutase family protein [Chloroflexota bacterium]